MESQQKRYVGLTVGFAVIGVGLLVAAFATDHWVKGNPHKVDVSGTNKSSVNPASSSFGLFSGQQSINFGSGTRSYSLKGACDASEGVCMYVFMRGGYEAKDFLDESIKFCANNTAGFSKVECGLFSFPLWVSTLVFLSLSIVMGLVTIGFSVFNIFGRPYETITGPVGLYLWNGLALLSIALTLALFGALFGTELSKNFLTYKDYELGWRSKDHTNLDFSFFFVVGAAGAFFVNFILLCLSGQSLSCSYSGSGEKEVDNGMILY